MFKYYNANPSGTTMPDCVTRAISLALDVDYYEVVYELMKNGKYYDCEDLCISCYENLLDCKYNLPHYKGSGKSVQQVINENPNDTLIIRMDGHLTCAINGLSYDIFDCTDYICTDYWVVDKARNYKEA